MIPGLPDTETRGPRAEDAAGLTGAAEQRASDSRDQHDCSSFAGFATAVCGNLPLTSDRGRTPMPAWLLFVGLFSGALVVVGVVGYLRD